MASSFYSQIPTILDLVVRLAPRTMLDVGKGLGKYGFLAHEYAGIDVHRRPDPTRTLVDQSRISIDAVESNPDYLWPHVAQLYGEVFVGRIEELYSQLPRYDLVLMCDVVEHMEKTDGVAVLKHFLQRGSAVVVSTPTELFRQELFESADEHHLSHWTLRDFTALSPAVDYQFVESSGIYLLSDSKKDLRGFGAAWIKRVRRLGRAVRNELRRAPQPQSFQ